MPRAAGKDDSDTSSNWDTAIAGSVSGLVSRFVIAPLDVVKIRLQLQHKPIASSTPTIGPMYSGILPTISTIVKEEGLTALWKGNIPAELLYVTYGAVQFYTYRNVHQLLDKTQDIHHLPESAQSFVAGGTAGAAATTLTYPLDLLRTRFAAQGNDRVYMSLAYSIRHIYQHEGFSGYFRGLSAGVTQIVPYMGLFFASYEPTRALLLRGKRESSSAWQSALAGGIASTVAKTGVFPLDLVRKRLQVQGPTREKYVHRNIPLYEGVVRTLRAIVMAEGWRGLYRGLVVSLVKAAPLSAVTMWTYEQTMKIISAGKAKVNSIV